MKNIRKILIALCLAAVLVATAAVGSFALADGNISTGSEANFEDYWSVNKVLYDGMEEGTSASGAAGAVGSHVKVSGKETVYIVDDDRGAPYIYGEDATATSSKYYSTINYANKESGSLYVQPRFKNLSGILANTNPTTKAAETPVDGFVMEFDIATLEGEMSSFDIQILNHSSLSQGSISVAKYSATDGVATITGISGQGNKVDSPVTVTSDRGGWLHVTVLYNPKAAADEQLCVYVNKAQVDREGAVERTLIYKSDNLCDATDKDKKWCNGELAVYPLHTRLGNQGATSGSFSLDNFLFYQGVAVCDPEYMSTLSDEELFEKYVDVLDSDTPTNLQKFKAYETIASDYIPLFADSTDAEILALIARYESFVENKFSGIYEAAKKENAAKLRQKVDDLVVFGRGLANIYDRESALGIVDSFIDEVASLIYIGDERTEAETDPYLTAMADYEAYSQYILWDKDIRSFKNRMDRFAVSAEFNSSDAMQRHYNEAYALIASVEQLYVGDGTGFELYLDFAEIDAIKAAKDAYDAAGPELEGAISKTNSRRFIDLMKLLDGTTRTDWDADTGRMRNLWYLARGIILNADQPCDESVEGFAGSKEFYLRLDAFFWAKLQDEHVALLTEKLDTFDASGATYIDKAGVCTFVDNYIERNYGDIEHTDSRIKNIKSRNELYKTQLDQLNVDYSALLYQQTLEFKYKMDEITTLKGYAALKAAFDQATKFYYAMNVAVNGLGDASEVTNEELKIAMARYEELSKWLTKVETMSTVFIDLMKEFPSSKDKDALYAALSVCYGCEEFLDVTFEYTEDDVTYKVSDYKGRYDAAKSSYVSGTATANRESSAALDIVCATRAFGGIGNLLKYVQDNLK